MQLLKKDKITWMEENKIREDNQHSEVEKNVLMV